MTTKRKTLPTQERLNGLLDYNADTGILTWKRRSADSFPNDRKYTAERLCNAWNSVRAGKPAGTVEAMGYRIIGIDGVIYKEHRVIFMMVYGWCPEFLDHEDGDSVNNKIKNILPSDQALNATNIAKMPSNKTGYTGISWFKQNKKWRAMIARKWLGDFASINDAIAARQKAETKMGYHPQHGRRSRIDRRRLSLQ